VPRPSVVLAFLVALAAAFSVVDYLYPNSVIWNAFASFLVLSIIYLAFRILLVHYTIRHISDEPTRYTVQRLLSVLWIVVSLAALIAIWVENAQAVVVSYGIIGAGLAIALQDVFRNLAGGLIVLFSRTYKVGDRIEVNGKTGDVIDLGIMYTTILELREWVDANQPTGRLSTVPNSAVIDSVINNFSRDFSFMWAELELPVTYESNWRAAKELALQVMREVVGGVTAAAEKEMMDITQTYYLRKISVEPAVYLTLTTNWIDLHIRYPVPVQETRIYKNKIFTRLLEEIEKRDDITIASTTETISIAKFPPIEVEGKPP
jgi:small-conductance mechanosensitive channel